MYADRKPRLVRFLQQERVCFLLTNRIPRRALTLFMGWFSRIETPWIRDLSLAVWRRFADDLRLDEAKKQRFTSLHDCFTRELLPGTRDVDARRDVLSSPCDAIVGASGLVDGTDVVQAKGFPYTLEDLLIDPELVERHRDGRYVTLRLKSSMYHRFHAPCACRVKRVTYVSGDTWNVDPIALKRIERLFCRNERAVIPLETDDGEPLTLVPVAAILVAGIRLLCLGSVLDLRYRGPNELACDAAYEKGEEMGYFQHGSTIIVFTSNAWRLADGVEEGRRIQMGEALFMRVPTQPDRVSKASNTGDDDDVPRGPA